MAKLPSCYWDSSCFLAWLKPEEERVPGCREVINAAERGEIKIVTSAVALTEVVKLRKGQPIAMPKEHEQRIAAFFQKDFISIVQVTRHIAESARSLVWRFPHLYAKDALHVASALYAQRFGPLEEIHTFDGDFLPLDGQLGTPPLRIREPQMAQRSLPLEPPPSATAEAAEEEDEEDVDDEEAN